MMHSLLEILNKARKKHALFSKRLDEAAAFHHWPQAVGELIAKKTKPIRVMNNILWVEVQDPIWRSELLYRKKQVLEALQSVSKEYPIENIQFLAPLKKSHHRTYIKKV